MTQHDVIDISIIIAMSNMEAYITPCLESILTQTTDASIEILVVDDASSDASVEIVRKMAHLDKRIRYFIQPVGKGQAAARNVALENARGEYICIVDADDMVSQNGLQTLHAASKSGKWDLIVAEYSSLLPDGTLLAAKPHFNSNCDFTTEAEIVGYIVNDNVQRGKGRRLLVMTWARLFRRALLEEHRIRYDESCSISEDIVFNFSFVRCAHRIYYITTPVYIYRIRPGSTSVTRVTPFRTYKKIASLIFEALLSHNMPRKEAAALAKQELVYRSISQLLVLQRDLILKQECANLHSHAVIEYIREAMGDPEFQAAVATYKPRGKENRWIPFFMKWRLPRLAAMAVNQCARRQVGKIGLRDVRLPPARHGKPAFDADLTQNKEVENND